MRVIFLLSTGNMGTSSSIEGFSPAYVELQAVLASMSSDVQPGTSEMAWVQVAHAPRRSDIETARVKSLVQAMNWLAHAVNVATIRLGSQRRWSLLDYTDVYVFRLAPDPSGGHSVAYEVAVDFTDDRSLTITTARTFVAFRADLNDYALVKFNMQIKSHAETEDHPETEDSGTVGTGAAFTALTYRQAAAKFLADHSANTTAGVCIGQLPVPADDEYQCRLLNGIWSRRPAVRDLVGPGGN